MHYILQQITINVDLASAPTVNQALIATSSTAATCQTVNHGKLLIMLICQI